ncbi:MAG: hypothetical protein ACYC4Q_04930 [Victivallaceae bacterium]
MKTNESHVYIQHKPGDGGPAYKETDLSRFPVEPFNTFSSLLFFILAVYWTWKTKLNVYKHPLTTVCMPILLIGCIGGILYHATRGSSIWLQLDCVPVLVLALSSGIYLWRRLTGNYFLTFILTICPLLISFFMLKYIHIADKFTVSAVYSALALNILIPAVLHCVMKNRDAWLTLLLAFSAFAIALAFRQADRLNTFSCMTHGTHFLWHIFGCISSFFIIKYIYFTEEVEFIKKKQIKLSRKECYKC